MVLIVAVDKRKGFSPSWTDAATFLHRRDDPELHGVRYRDVRGPGNKHATFLSAMTLSVEVEVLLSILAS